MLFAIAVLLWLLAMVGRCTTRITPLMYGFSFFFYKSTVTTNTVCVNTLQMMVKVRQNKKLPCIYKRWKQQKKKSNESNLVQKNQYSLFQFYHNQIILM